MGGFSFVAKNQRCLLWGQHHRATMCIGDRGSGGWVNLSKALSQGVRRLKGESIPENCLCVIPPRIHYSTVCALWVDTGVPA